MSRIAIGLRILVLTVAAGALLHSTVRASRAAAMWVRAPAAEAGEGQLTPLDRRLSVEPGSALEALRSVERGIVFVFASDCAICDANMANWTDLVRDLDGSGVPLFAVTPDDREGSRDYWSLLARRVTVIEAPPREIADVLGVDYTPVTIVLRDGRIQARAAGVLTRDAMDDLMDFGAR